MYDWFQKVWYGESSGGWLLLPLSWLYRSLIELRLLLLKLGILHRETPSLPVIIIGNLNVGGTGKTPLTLELANRLRERGLQPGIVSRGYGGVKGARPVLVSKDSDPAIVGDEPLLLARNTQCPVVVHPDRVAAVERLADEGVNVVISDDGLQHYRMRRNYEVVVVDGARGFGNGKIMPAGPLREPLARLKSVDQVMIHGKWEMSSPPPPNAMSFSVQADAAISLAAGAMRPLAEFSGRTVHAVAGIGNPDRFFATLRGQGVSVIEHAFPDHAKFRPEDLSFGDDLPVLMTEKDVVKCETLGVPNCWYVPVKIVVEELEFAGWLEHLEHCLAQEKPIAGISYR